MERPGYVPEQGWSEMENLLPAGGMETTFLRQLPVLKEVIRAVCRRHQIPADEATEFSASVFLKVIEDDYAVLRRFRSSGDPKAFLFTVVYHHMLDCRNHEWGKWRASARARQLGSAAVFLEQLIVRDRVVVQEAVAVLANHPRWELSSHDVRQLHGQLQHRVPRWRPVALGVVEETCAMPSVPSDIEMDELREEAQRARRALASAIRGLPADERRLLRMRFQDGRPISEIAGVLRVEVKPLYRRFTRILRQLREELERRRLTQTVVRALVGRECAEFGSEL
jgi:RNA polymerase sigma factor (sigma-70 family)